MFVPYTHQLMLLGFSAHSMQPTVIDKYGVNAGKTVTVKYLCLRVPADIRKRDVCCGWESKNAD